jgi:hypothetical protein
MPTMPDFAGKIVVFYMASGAASLSLESIEASLLGGRATLVGRVPQFSGDEWISTLPAAVVWEHVSHYIVFDSHEDYRRRMGVATAESGIFRRLSRWLWGA